MNRLFLILLLAAASIRAEDKDPEETFQMKNGRFWSHLGSGGSGDYKAAFLLGLIDGWTLRGMTKNSVLARELIAWKAGPNSTLSDLTASVTSVYAEKENQPLPIGWVVMGAYAVQRGDATRDLVFMALRKHLAQMMDGLARPASEVDPIDVIIQFRKQ